MLTIDAIKNSLDPFIEEYGIVKAGVFGSYARDEATENSDVDLLILFNKRFGLLKLIHLKQSIEDKLGKPVDIVEYDSRNTRFVQNALSEVVIFYDGPR